MSTPLTPECEDSTIGDAPPEKGGDVLDELLDNHATGGWSDDDPSSEGVGDPEELDAGASGRPNTDPEANREI